VDSKVKQAFKTLYEALLIETAHDNTRKDKTEILMKIAGALVELDKKSEGGKS